MAEAVGSDLEHLKAEVKRLYDEKEAWFEKKRQLSSKVAEHIEKIKQHRVQRDDLTKFVQDAKIKRKELNQTIRGKIESIKSMHGEKQKAAPSTTTSSSSFKDKNGQPKRMGPTQLLKEIKKMEYRIETDGMTFDAEQKVMKRIKEMQQQYEQTKHTDSLFKDLRSLSKEIDDLKKESDSIHDQIQQKAVQSQEFHETMISLSQLVDKLKEEEKQATEKFQEFKTQYTEVSKKLKDILGEAVSLQKHVRAKEHAAREKQDQEAEQKRKKTLAEQEARVKEKIKRGETLTTEDLYIFQNMADEDEETSA